MMLAHRWRGDAWKWDEMTSHERAELIALDRYITAQQNKGANSGKTSTMSKAERLAAFQQQRQQFNGGE